MSRGLQFREIAVEGDNQQPASVKFRSGLNVIAGESDTGKTYIFQLLNFMLGSNTVPKRVPESLNYSLVKAEIETSGGNTLSLVRSFYETDFQLFRAPLSRVGPKDLGRLVRESSYVGDDDNISDVLFGAIGIDEVKIRRGNDNSTQKLSIRNLVRMALVNEERIIAERPPVFGLNPMLSVLERSIFDYMLTGRGSDGQEVIPNPKIRKTEWTTRVSVYDELIGQAEKEIQSKSAQIQFASMSLDQIEAQITSATTSVGIGDEAISKAVEERNGEWENLQRAQSRLIVLSELIERFSLLRAHYESDLERLDFIAEGQHFFAQLETASCPLCGKPLDKHEQQELCDSVPERLEDIASACRSEKQKIHKQLGDLASTLDALRSESEAFQQASRDIGRNINRIETHIFGELEPQTNAERMRVDELLQARRLLIDIAADERKLEGFRAAREQLGTRPKPVRRPKKYTGDTSQSKKLLGESIHAVLTGWDYLKDGGVTFDDNLDLVVNGRARSTHGKGVRAVLHAAFTIGLMRFCLNNGLPHPGFVILDSPVTTFFRAAEGADAVGDEGEKKKLQDSFYTYLSQSGNNEQIVILENIVPPTSIINKINYIHFGGPDSTGRKGFFP